MIQSNKEQEIMLTSTQSNGKVKLVPAESQGSHLTADND